MILVDDALLRKTARRFKLGFRIATVLTLALTLGVMAAAVIHTEATGARLASLTGYAVQPQAWQSLALAALVCIGLSLYAATFAAATTVSGALSRGEMTVAGRAARRLSRWLWAMLFWSVAAHTLAVLIATAHGGPDQHVLSFAFGSPQISIALAALVAAFLAELLALVAALWEDHKEIV